MGFYDFLKTIARTGPEGGGEAWLPLEGLTPTRIILALLEVPPVDRGDAWKRQFLDHVKGAAFYCGDPRIIAGSDQRPYFVLRTPRPGQDYPSHVLHHMKDDFLLEQGLGVVINPEGQDADWAFTFGDIVNYHLQGSFYPPQSHLSPILEGPGRDAGSDPEAGLPGPVAAALRTYLRGQGVAEPRVLISSRGRTGPGSLELVFNFAPGEFRDLDAFRTVMSTLSWFLPRNYSYSVAGNEARTAAAFQPL
jgi:hypothetical protein